MKKLNRLMMGLFIVSFLCFMVGCQPSTTPADSTGTKTSSGSGTDTSGNSTNTSTTPSTNPDSQVSGLDGESTVGNNESSDPVAQRIGSVAANYPSQYSTRGSFPYAAGTENGNLGCANVVSQALKDAGVNVWSLGVDDCASQIRQQGFRSVNPPPYLPGDVIVWGPGPSGHKHIGIAAQNGNSIMAMNNSSSSRHPVFSNIEYRSVESVLRKS